MDCSYKATEEFKYYSEGGRKQARTPAVEKSEPSFGVLCGSFELLSPSSSWVETLHLLLFPSLLP